MHQQHIPNPMDAPNSKVEKMEDIPYLFTDIDKELLKTNERGRNET